MLKNVIRTAAIFSLVFLSNCKDKVEYSIIPEISMSERQVYNSPNKLIVAFTDGDGDIGLNDRDTLPPYNFVPDTSNENISSNLHYYNLLFYYYVNNEGVWEEGDLALPLFYRVPVITPSGQNKALKGEIEVDVVFDQFYPDSFRFEVELTDRALHISNRIVTPTIYR